MWREGLGAYKIITEDKKGYRNHPATKEFEHAPRTLFLRLEGVRSEMLRRGYHPKELPPAPRASANAAEEVHEWQSLEEQIVALKEKRATIKGCLCTP